MTTRLERLVKCWGEIAPTRPPTSNPILLIDWLILIYSICNCSLSSSLLFSMQGFLSYSIHCNISTEKTSVFITLQIKDFLCILTTWRQSGSGHCFKQGVPFSFPLHCWLLDRPDKDKTFTNTKTNIHQYRDKHGHQHQHNPAVNNSNFSREKKITFAVVFQL